MYQAKLLAQLSYTATELCVPTQSSTVVGVAEGEPTLTRHAILLEH